MRDDIKQNEATTSGTGPPGIRFDWQDWLPYIADLDVPEDQKRELIETLFTIVIGFVDLGFGLNPAQNICGKEIDLTALLKAGMVDYDQPTNVNKAGASAAPLSGDEATAERSRP